MLDKKHSIFKSLSSLIASLAIFGIAAFLLLNQQYVKDQVTVWSYSPASNVEHIKDRIDLTGKGQFYFYATQPVVDGSDQFNADCPRQEVKSPILGCYAAGRIYIYDVTNSELGGIEEVTAAHEMLHAAWERMDASEQVRIGSLLRAEYQKHTSDKDFVERMDYYQRTEPGEFENELHSILGTEFGNLDPALESYYGKYFHDRSKVLALHDKYNSVFVGLRNQSEQLFNELTALATSIDARSTKYNSDVQDLSTDIASFNTRADNGDFPSTYAFNSERAVLLARSNQLDEERDSISSDIDTYNKKYTEYEKISSQIEQLNKSIDSIKDLQPSPSV